MKKLVYPILTLFIANVAFSQETYEKMYYQDKELTVEKCDIKINNAVGLENEVKFSLKMNNNSNHAVFYRPGESKFVLPTGEVDVLEKEKMVKPEGSKVWTINGMKKDMNKEQSFTFNLSGIYEIIPEKEYQKVDELKLPLQSNEFGTDKIKFAVLNSVKKTSNTWVKIEVTNNSDQYLLIHPSRVSARMPDGNLYACSNKKADMEVVKPGESTNFTVSWEKMPGGSKNDMQLRDMYIVWDNVVFFGNERLLDGEVIEFEWNETVTKEKN